MKLSVIFTTYNSPDWLQKVFWGFSEQQHQDFEIVVADDGSDDVTRQLIERSAQELDLDITHIWHRDDGFRKCRILNKAILAAKQDYVVFTDGDCIPRRDFLTTHARRAEPGYYLSGSYYKLPLSTSQMITRDDIASQRCFDYQWLRQNGLPATAKKMKISAGRNTARWLNALTPTACNFKGSNASAWRKDLIAVGGFDERMQWGGLDREIGVRLKNSGIKPRHVRYDAVCVHLDHARSYANPENVAANKALRQRVEKEKIRATQHGLSQLTSASNLESGQSVLSCTQ